MRDYYIVYKKKILQGPMSKEEAIVKLFELSTTFKGLRVRLFFGKKNKPLSGERQESSGGGPSGMDENNSGDCP